MKKYYILTIVILLFSRITFSQTSNEEWIIYTKNSDAAFLEIASNSGSIEEWVVSMAEGSKAIDWSVNDCGENEGAGKREYYPVCVQATIKYSEKHNIAILLVVGNTKIGVVPPPKLWMVYSEKEGKYDVITKQHNTIESFVSSNKPSNE